MRTFFFILFLIILTVIGLAHLANAGSRRPNIDFIYIPKMPECHDSYGMYWADGTLIIALNSDLRPYCQPLWKKTWESELTIYGQCGDSPEHTQVETSDVVWCTEPGIVK